MKNKETTVTKKQAYEAIGVLSKFIKTYLR